MNTSIELDIEEQIISKKAIELQYEQKIDFSDINPMFGDAPKVDADAIQRDTTNQKIIKI